MVGTGYRTFKKNKCDTDNNCISNRCSFGVYDTEEQGYCCSKGTYWDSLAGGGAGACIEGASCGAAFTSPGIDTDSDSIWDSACCPIDYGQAGANHYCDDIVVY